MRQRSVGATAMNEQSSRSHMVFMLQLRGTNELSGQRVSGAQALPTLPLVGTPSCVTFNGVLHTGRVARTAQRVTTLADGHRHRPQQASTVDQPWHLH